MVVNQLLGEGSIFSYARRGFVAVQQEAPRSEAAENDLQEQLVCQSATSTKNMLPQGTRNLRIPILFLRSPPLLPEEQDVDSKAHRYGVT